MVFVYLIFSVIGNMKIKLIIGGNNLNFIGEVENRKELYYFISYLFLL